MMEHQIIHPTRRMKSPSAVQAKAELHVMGALCVLAHNLPSQVISSNTNISKEEHWIFFHKFIDYFFHHHTDDISLPSDTDELREVSWKCSGVSLPGCMGSKDVVHVKWARAPKGDFNQRKGKESYPSFAFQCKTNFERRILGVHHAQYGTCNFKAICRQNFYWG